MQAASNIEIKGQPVTATKSKPALLQPISIVDLGDRLRITVEVPVTESDHPSRRRALAKAWEALAAAISETKAALPPMPAPPRPKMKRKKTSGTRTGSGSWWQF